MTKYTPVHVFQLFLSLWMKSVICNSLTNDMMNMKDLHAGVECFLSKLANDTGSGGALTLWRSFAERSRYIGAPGNQQWHDIQQRRMLGSGPGIE